MNHAQLAKISLWIFRASLINYANTPKTRIDTQRKKCSRSRVADQHCRELQQVADKKAASEALLQAYT